MATEKQWRRSWKESLKWKPWNHLRVEVGGFGADFLLKYFFTNDSYEILISDLSQVYYEALDSEVIKKRNKKLNPSIEAPLEKLIDTLRDNLEERKKETKFTASLKAIEETNDEKMLLAMDTTLAGLPFLWKFSAKPVNRNTIADQMTLPLICMIAELSRRQQELQKALLAKDKEIEDLKGQGVTVSRKHFETPKFDEASFSSNMQFSKGFEETIQSLGISAFSNTGQRLYKEVMIKRAWLSRENDDDVPESQAAALEEAGESWANRLPPSLALSPRKSPKKSPAKSPAKPTASNAASSSEDTQAEFVRKQALQKRLAEEDEKREAKQQKKKKKMKF